MSASVGTRSSAVRFVLVRIGGGGGGGAEIYCHFAARIVFS